MPLSQEDLALAAAGCRALAEIRRKDLERQSNPGIRKGFEREITALQALADRFERTRKARHAPR